MHGVHVVCNVENFGGELRGISFFFFKQKTAYEIVSRDWSSDVCSPISLSSLILLLLHEHQYKRGQCKQMAGVRIRKK